jgi:arylsulfatase A-like enzyme
MSEASAGPHVVLLTVDALRADHVGHHGYDRETTPFLDGLADEGLVFTDAFAPSSHTRESVPSILTGAYPDAFASAGYRLPEDIESIAERFSAAGYRTAAFHSNPYVSRAYGFDRGFDAFDDDLALGRNRWVALAQRALNKYVLRRGRYHVRAEELNRRALDWLDSVGTDRPVFLWCHYMDVHGPYCPPEGYREWMTRSCSPAEAQSLYHQAIDEPESLSESEERLLVDAYDGEIRYLDAQLQSMVDALRERGVWDDAVGVVTADHGDAFGEHGYHGHPRRLDEEVVRVPLVADGVESGRVSSVTSLVDLVPSLLDAAGVEGSERSWLGSDEQPRVVFCGAQGEDEHEGTRLFAGYDGERVAFVRRDADGIVEESSRPRVDVAEADVDAVAGRQSEDSDALLEAVRAHACDRTPGAVAVDEVDDEEVAERLEALGYR